MVSAAIRTASEPAANTASAPQCVDPLNLMRINCLRVRVFPRPCGAGGRAGRWVHLGMYSCGLRFGRGIGANLAGLTAARERGYRETISRSSVATGGWGSQNDRSCEAFRTPARRPIRTHRRQAFEKRQWTKSREVGRLRCGGRYEGLIRTRTPMRTVERRVMPSPCWSQRALHTTRACWHSSQGSRDVDLSG